ncbi:MULTISPECIES: gliding motility-associated C-terminal domain-containing protein [unclassified Chryseobacterium]|uniref:T9SS type B sorting domain-containing protein n=1 Tax=unclassified Chryseobacterium TaxID=2593645 RepID=UPI0028533062|nr:gliding motility-associated C-terminal domain-containing protein [Chryseobacterium sp. CFS7]MDR4894217.1 gliding motility-associated C-terminal domain-containing protein [Chryseobacterium sp. CFS7]
MKKILSLFMVLNAVLLFSQNLLWHFQTTSPIIESQHNIAFSGTDSQGNIYVGGKYGHYAFPSINSITFDNITKTTSVDEDSRAVIAKFDKNKNVIWVKEIRSKYSSSITSLVVDKQDNLVFTGYTDGHDLKLNPNSETIFNTGINSGSAFMVKLDVNGNFVFGNIYNYVYNMTCTIDSNNNIISTGNYANYPPLFITDLNPDPNVVFNLPAPNGLFVMKNTPAGAFSWARPIHAHNTPTIHTVKTDQNNSIVILGHFEAGLKIDNNNFPSNNSSYNQAFLAKFNTNGNFTWYQPLTYSSIYLGTANSKIEIDNAGNIYTASTYNQPQNIVFPNTTINAPVEGRTMIYKINSNGHLVWNSLIKGDGSYDFLSIKMNADNTLNFFVRYTDNMIKVVNGNNNTEEIVKRMDIGLNYSYLTNDAQTYYLKFRNDGKLIFNKSDFSSYTFDQNIDYEGNIILTGNYDGYQDFNPDQDIKEIKYTNSDVNSFVQKFGKCYNGTPDGDKIQTFCSLINPTIHDLHPNTSYTTWYDSLTSTTPLSSTTPLQHNTIYYASVQDESCPYNNKRLAVKVIIKNSPPTLTVNDFYFCSNVNQMTLSQLNINNNQNIRFYNAAGNLMNSSAYIIEGAQYYVTQYSAECESDKAPFKVFSIQGVTPTGNTQQTFCATSNPKISDIQVTGQNIKWYDAAGNILPATTALANGQTYYATQTINGCESNKIAIQVTVNTTPKPTANANQDFCASANPTLEKIVVTGTSLTFYNAAGNVIPMTTPLVNGQTYFVTQTLNNCESEKLAITVTLSTDNVPAKDITQVQCNTTTANSMVVNLHSYEASIINNPGNYIFTYTDTAGNPISNPSGYVLNVGTTLIHVRVATPDGCFKVVRLNLTLNPKPIVQLPDTLDFCEGKSVVLDAGSGFKSYEWNTGATTQTITVATPGTYTVKVTNIFGCESTSSTQVSYSVLAHIVSVNITNNTATVILSQSGNYEFSLDNFTWQDSNIFTHLQMGEYTVYVRTKSGCTIGKKNFSIFNIPNAISPNGDGINDTWRIAGLENYPGTEVSLYDRRGAMVYKEIIKNRPFQWDGRYESHAVSTGNYWYTIKVSDGRIYNGWLLIKNRE